jgi:hypothetical protein
MPALAQTVNPSESHPCATTRRNSFVFTSICKKGGGCHKRVIPKSGMKTQAKAQPANNARRIGLLEDGFDFANRNRAFAKDFPVLIVDADDRGRQAHSSFAGVEHEGQAQTELLHQLLGVGAGGETRNIGAGARDRPAEFVDKLLDHGMLWPAERDFAGVGGDFERHSIRGFDDQRQPAGPERLRQLLKIPRCVVHARDLFFRLAHQHQRLVQRVDQDRQGPRFGSALYSIELVHGRKVEWIGG